MSEPDWGGQTGLVSIMMPAFNAEQYIGAAIDSVLAQTYAQWELVVVDDGSTDGTAQVVKRYADPRIRLVTQANGGEATARNRALQCVRGELLAFLDADDQFLPEHLAVLAGYLHGNGGKDAVYGDGFYMTSEGQRRERLSAYRRGPFEGKIFEQLVRASDVFGPPICIVARRGSIVQRGLMFDPEIVIGPDWDFMTRLAEAADFGYVEQATVLYRVHPTNITRVTGERRRQQSLARCREKAIKLAGFGGCTRATRWYAFYDLLVNLLQGMPERQAEILSWPEFKALPREDQARLLRLMASQAVRQDDTAAPVAEWLRQARRLNPSDWRGTLVVSLYRLSPRLCHLVLRAKAEAAPQPAAASPFGVLK